MNANWMPVPEKAVAHLGPPFASVAMPEGGTISARPGELRGRDCTVAQRCHDRAGNWSSPAGPSIRRAERAPVK